MKQKISGIYLIEDIVTGNAYAGQSKDIGKRWSHHASFMKNNEHKYKELQEAYNEDCKRIKYTILEECKASELQEREDWWFNYIPKVEGWNLINKQRKGGASKSVTDTSNMSKAQTGENNGHNTKLSVEDVKEIKKMLSNCFKPSAIAEKFGVSLGLIYGIKNKTRWASVEV